MLMNIQTTVQLHSFYMLARQYSKSFKVGFSNTWTKNFQTQARFSKGRGSREQIANICWIIEKAKEWKKFCFCFIDYTKVFDCVDHNKLWKILREMGIPEHFTCLLKSLCADQEATIRTGQETMSWFKTGKGVYQGCILSPCLLNLYSECIM